ncbi:MAG: S9 family peptidase [candidate division Zixibacteria bacterium]|nr:S9 family peptidase [candidate division Zixibacteria bacterium]
MKKTRPPKPRKRKLTAEDLYKLRLPGSVSLSPCEKFIAYTVERMDKKEKKYFSNIFMHDLSADRSLQFTHGDHNDQLPVWSPDGSRLAFISTRDKKTGIYIMPSGGGAEKKLIEIEGAVSHLQWTPDAKHLVFALRYNDSHYIKDEKEKKEPPVYRYITRLFFRLDGMGYIPKDRFQIYALDIEKAKLRKITRGRRDNINPNLSPDGKWIVYISNRRPNEDLESKNLDLFVIPFRGGRERKIPTPAGPVFDPKFSPDGKLIAYLGHDNPNDAWGVTNFHIWLVGVNNVPKAKDLMPKYDRCTYDQTIGDMGEGGGTNLSWSKESKQIYFLSSDMGVTNLFYVPRGGGKPTRVFKGDCHIKDFSLNGKTQTVAFVYSDLINPGEIMTCPARYGGEKKAVCHTRLNKFLQHEVTLGQTREVRFKSFDGTEVQGWLVKPPDFKTGRRYPSILEIHGGPRVQYGFTFFHEMQYLAAQGFVVLYTNPRGGQGRGETWAEAIIADWGGLDYKDCMAAADYLAKQKFINPKKMGVTGGSYGGYMTNWIIGHTDRFKAAVTQRSVVNLSSFVGSSDCGYELRREFKGWPWTTPETFEKCSPITYFKNVKTPVLIIHSEQDLRCSIEQAEEMFVMLKVLGKKVEMVRFPGEPHGLSRHGRPDRRIARLDWIVKWFKRYLK